MTALPAAANHPSTAIDLDRAVLALSEALDLIGVDERGHGHRVALMAAACARELGWPPDRVKTLLRAGLLHDCGVSSTREHRHLVDELDWEGARAHCLRGAEYLSAVPALAHLAPIIAEHHSSWSELTRRQVDPAIALTANLLYLVDRADTLHLRGLVAGKDVVEVLMRHRGIRFASELLDVFRELALREVFWFIQDDPALHERTAELAADGEPQLIGMGEVKALADMFARIIDAKSPYTERHSRGVARVACLLGRLFGLDGVSLDQLEVAGLLHDLGKLRIPDEILDKQGPLTAEERRIMARHAFDTWEILRKAFGNGAIAQWASFHHEGVEGGGYPFHREGEELALEARIIAVADVAQALAQRRPYRAPLNAAEIVQILDGMVFAGRLDREVVARAKSNMDTVLREAVAEEGLAG